MQDHNKRIIVFGTDGEQARSVAGDLASGAFHNVSFFGGTVEELMQAFSSEAVSKRLIQSVHIGCYQQATLAQTHFMVEAKELYGCATDCIQADDSSIF